MFLGRPPEIGCITPSLDMWYHLLLKCTLTHSGGLCPVPLQADWLVLGLKCQPFWMYCHPAAVMGVAVVGIGAGKACQPEQGKVEKARVWVLIHNPFP